jgi:hypothetical protein
MAALEVEQSEDFQVEEGGNSHRETHSSMEAGWRHGNSQACQKQLCNTEGLPLYIAA